MTESLPSVGPDLLVRGGTLLSMTEKSVPVQQDLLIRDGRIVGVGEFPDTGVEVLNASSCVVLPGLIQSHVHLCQTLCRGSAEDLQLLPWLQRHILPFEAAHDEASMRASAQLSAAELLLSGTTGVLTMESVRHSDVAFEVLGESGLHGATGRCLVDRSDGCPPGFSGSTEKELKATIDQCGRQRGKYDGRIGFVFNPRFALSCTESLLRDCVIEARRLRARLHTHSSENLAEVAQVREETGLDNVEYLHQVGFTGEDVILAHCIHLSDRGKEILADTKTNVAHCPSANLKLGSGIARIAELRSRGVPICLGADGAPCNNNLDVFVEMRLMGLLSKVVGDVDALSPRGVLEAATVGGAAALGRSADLGTLEPGKRGNLTLVDLSGLHCQPLPPDAIESTLVYGARSSDVRATVIDGKVLCDRGRLLEMDEDSIRDEAQRQRALTVERARGLGFQS